MNFRPPSVDPDRSPFPEQPSALLDDDGVSREPTRSYECLVRPPATPQVDWRKHPITAGFCAGTLVDDIVDSIARGDEWRVGPARDASGTRVIWLSRIDVPYDRQIAAWLVSPQIASR